MESSSLREAHAAYVVANVVASSHHADAASMKARYEANPGPDTLAAANAAASKAVESQAQANEKQALYFHLRDRSVNPINP